MTTDSSRRVKRVLGIAGVCRRRPGVANAGLWGTSSADAIRDPRFLAVAWSVVFEGRELRNASLTSLEWEPEIFRAGNSPPKKGNSKLRIPGNFKWRKKRRVRSRPLPRRVPSILLRRLRETDGPASGKRLRHGSPADRDARLAVIDLQSLVSLWQLQLPIGGARGIVRGRESRIGAKWAPSGKEVDCVSARN